MKKLVFFRLLSKVDKGCDVPAGVYTKKEVSNIYKFNVAMRWLTRTFDDEVFS